MTKYNWNYEELGFNSEAEMHESIIRVERRMKQSDYENEIERMKKSQSNINTQGGVNLEAIWAGAKLEELDRVVHNQILLDKEQAKRKAEQEEMQALMSRLAERTDKEKKEEAEREFRKQKEKLNEELQKEIFEKHNVKTDEEQVSEDALKTMLGKLFD